MALKIITSSDQKSLADMLSAELERTGDIQGCTILVPTRAAGDGLRRILQRNLQDFAPPIHTLEAWLDNLTLLSIDLKRRPGLVLSPSERVLALEFFLQTSGNDNRGFASQKALKAGASIAGDLQRAGCSLADLLTEAVKEKRTREPRFARSLAEFGAWLDEKKWMNREAVPAMLEKPDPDLLPRKMLVLFEIDYLFETQKRGLAPVMRLLNAADSRDVVVFQTVEIAEVKIEVKIEVEAEVETSTEFESDESDESDESVEGDVDVKADSDIEDEVNANAGVRAEGNDEAQDENVDVELVSKPVSESGAGFRGRGYAGGLRASNTYPGDYLNWLITQFPGADLSGNMGDYDRQELEKDLYTKGRKAISGHWRSEIASAVVEGRVANQRVVKSQSESKGSGDPASESGSLLFESDVLDEVALITCHDERAEIDHVLRTITMEIALGKGASGASAPAYSDYVIMTGNTNRYRPLVKALASKYRVPVDIQPADPLISNPVVRRFIRLLELELLDFGIDAIYEIFADNLFTLPGLTRNNEEQAPNIRSFTQFCRKYNIRTLDEASERIAAVRNELDERSGDPVPDDFDHEKFEQTRARVQREMDYYDQVVGLLTKYRAVKFSMKNERLSDWIRWAESLAEAQKSLGTREAGLARNLFLEMLRKLNDSYQRLELDPVLDAGQFVRLVRLSAEEQREKAVRYPNGVLFCDITHFPLTNGKKVFITGMHESGLVTSDSMDFLRFRYHRELGRLLRDNKPDAYLKARFHLLRQILNAREIVLSRPLHSGDQKVIGSVLWQDLLYTFDLEEKNIAASALYGIPAGSGPAIQDSEKTINLPGRDGSKNPGSQTEKQSGDFRGSFLWCVDSHEMEIVNSESNENSVEQYYSSNNHDETINENIDGDINESSDDHNIRLSYPELLAAIYNDRQNPVQTGAWDGVLDAFEHPVLKARATAAINRWWEWQINRNNGRLQLSISRLDEFAASPLDYFFNRVLRLQPMEEYRDDAESNVKGLIVHAILQHFYSPESTYSDIPMVRPADDYVQARVRIGQIAERVLSDYQNQLGYNDSPFPGLLRTNIQRLTEWFLNVEAGVNMALDEPDYRPSTFLEGSGLAMEHNWSFVRNWSGIEVLMNGFIDRVDVHPGMDKAVVYDYKTGTYVKAFTDIRNGMSFQLPMYFMALKENGFSSLAGAYYKVLIGRKASDLEIDYRLGSDKILGGYRDRMHTKNKRRAGFMPDDELNELLAETERKVEWIVCAMRNGNFSQSLTGRSPWSDYNSINRYNMSTQKQREKDEREAAEKAGTIPHRYYIAGCPSDESDSDGGDGDD